MKQLSDLINIGKTLEEQLILAGIKTPEDLNKVGSKDAWTKIKRIGSSACYNRLCALEGAIQGIRWHNLDIETKKDLKAFYNTFK